MDTARDGKNRVDEASHDYDWEAVNEAFDRVYSLPDDERARAVERLPDGPVRDGVWALMAGAERASFLDRRDEDQPGSSETAAFVVRGRKGRGERPGFAGPFTLLHEVGQGGMGTVFLAVDPSTGQRAAVKVLKTDSEDAAVRFALEARQLAAFDHVAIPKLLRQGETPIGQPYLAMEYVEGAPVTEFADARSLGTSERLALFALVCDAVRHAHRGLVAHLDVKPSNVLGYEGPEGEHRVALIDFGASKSLSRLGDGSGWNSGGLTGTGQRPGTPAYAAPEQMQEEGSAQSMAADVFSLGVLLYELLTSTRPADGGAPPSQVTPLGLPGRQEWAIDALVARAIDPDPGQRHASADALLTDVKRAQQGRGPAGARAPWTDRARWFAARNWLRIAAAGVCVLSTVAGLTLLHDRWSASRQEAESDLTVVVSEFLRSASGRDADALLVRAAEAMQHGLERQPEVQADLSIVVADVLAARGQCARAASLYGRATLLRTRTAQDHPVVVAGLRGQARCAAGRFGTASEARMRIAVASAEEALEVARTRYGARSVVAAAIETDLGLYHVALGEFGVAGDRLNSAEAVLGQLDPASESRRLQAVREEAGTRVVVFPDVSGHDGVLLARSRMDAAFARLLEIQGDYAGSAARARRAVRALADQRGARSDAWADAVAFGHAVEADALVRLGRPAEALRSTEQAVVVLQTQFGAGDPRTVRAQTASAALVAAPRRAAALLRGNIRDAEETGEPATLAAALQAYGRALYQAGDHDSAAAALEPVVTMRAGGAEPRVLALAYTDLSRLALERGDVARALGYSEEALRTAHALVPAPGVRLEVLLSAATARAEALVGAERADDAVSVLDPVAGAVQAAPEGMARAETVARAELALRAAYAQI